MLGLGASAGAGHGLKVLLRPDLINSKGKALVTAARLGTVWKKLSEHFITVVADTSMITLSTDYSIHFHDLYIDGKENAKMKGDRMKMLMLTIDGSECGRDRPRFGLDSISPEIGCL